MRFDRVMFLCCCIVTATKQFYGKPNLWGESNTNVLCRLQIDTTSTTKFDMFYTNVQNDDAYVVLRENEIYIIKLKFLVL